MAQTHPGLVPIENLSEEPYKGLIAYPGPTAEAVGSRIRQLRELGIDGLEFHGPLRIGKLSVLGKGVVGLVFSGTAEGKRVAVKIRRTDSRRASMNHEAEMIKVANHAGVGPELIGVSRDALEMQYVDGDSLPRWLSSLEGRGSRARVRTALRSLFEQCTRLDAYGLDHGELSRAHKNILVSDRDRPWILDFESASVMRRVNNFTSIAQYLLLSGRFARKMRRVLGPTNREELLRNLRLYKTGCTNNAFDSVLKMLRI